MKKNVAMLWMDNKRHDPGSMDNRMSENVNEIRGNHNESDLKLDKQLR